MDTRPRGRGSHHMTSRGKIPIIRGTTRSAATNARSQVRLAEFLFNKARSIAAAASEEAEAIAAAEPDEGASYSEEFPPLPNPEHEQPRQQPKHSQGNEQTCRRDRSPHRRPSAREWQQANPDEDMDNYEPEAVSSDEDDDVEVRIDNRPPNPTARGDADPPPAAAAQASCSHGTTAGEPTLYSPATGQYMPMSQVAPIAFMGENMNAMQLQQPVVQLVPLRAMSVASPAMSYVGYLTPDASPLPAGGVASNAPPPGFAPDDNSPCSVDTTTEGRRRRPSVSMTARILEVPEEDEL